MDEKPQESTSAIVPGSVVLLKSDEPHVSRLMTVVAIGTGGAKCVWRDAARHHHEAVYPLVALVYLG